jgi:hypothetical protein
MSIPANFARLRRRDDRVKMGTSEFGTFWTWRDVGLKSVCAPNLTLPSAAAPINLPYPLHAEADDFALSQREKVLVIKELFL